MPFVTRWQLCSDAAELMTTGDYELIMHPKTPITLSH